MRKKMALPEVEVKRLLKFQDQQQYASFSTTTWSHTEALNVVVEGDDNETRTSNKLRFAPHKQFNLRFEQPANTEFNYRVMLIKVFDKHSGPPTPTEVLANVATPSGAWMYSTYKVFDDYLSTAPRFKVLQDKSFRWNSNAGSAYNSTLRKFVIRNIPGANVEYDEDQTDGTFNKNSLHICILTDATATSSNHVISYQEYMKFLDR